MIRPKPARLKFAEPGAKIVPNEVRDGLNAFPKGRPPVASASLGITVAPPAPVESMKLIFHPEPPKHRLVVVGDSLSEGFQHGAIHQTHLSWGAILADEMGATFRTPNLAFGDGVPINLEAIARHLQREFPPNLPLLDLPETYLSLRDRVARNYFDWVFGAGRVQPFTPTPGVQIHNLAQFGYDVLDALERTETTERKGLVAHDVSAFFPVLANAGQYSSIHVLDQVHDTDGEPLSLIDGAKHLGEDGGIETLVIALGANNALGAVEHLDVRWSGPGYDTMDGKDNYTVWRPRHFAATYARLVEQVKDVNAQRVVLCTVPHVTIAPIARGVGKKLRPGSRYFPFYTRPWITDAQFNPATDPHITGDEARHIDAAIDQYNGVIEAAVEQARAEGRDWYVLDLCGILDRMATLRYDRDPAARPDWWTPAVIPDALAELHLDTRFFRSSPDPADPTLGWRTEGGWFGLDGIHPTTVGYAYLAWNCANLLHDAGVEFPNVNADGTVRFDWARWIAADSLISRPPSTVDAALRRIGQGAQLVDFVKHPFARRHVPTATESNPALGR